MPWPTPPPYYILIISPLAEIANVEATFYKTPTAALYTEADAPTRSVTHRAVNGTSSTNAAIRDAQQAAVDAHIALYGNDPSPAGVIIRKWLAGSANPYLQALSDNGLTQSAT